MRRQNQDDDNVLDVMDTVDGMPLRLVLATKGLLDAAARLWPELDDVPAEIRGPFGELCDVWAQEVERAIAESRRRLTRRIVGRRVSVARSSKWRGRRAARSEGR